MKTIMIVEDEVAISRVLAAYIKKAGYDCRVISREDEAIQQVGMIQPSLVLLDVMLPGADSC